MATRSARPQSLSLTFREPVGLVELIMAGPSGEMPMMVTAAGEQISYSIPLPERRRTSRGEVASPGRRPLAGRTPELHRPLIGRPRDRLLPWTAPRRGTNCDQLGVNSPALPTRKRVTVRDLSEAASSRPPRLTITEPRLAPTDDLSRLIERCDGLPIDRDDDVAGHEARRAQGGISPVNARADDEAVGPSPDHPRLKADRALVEPAAGVAWRRSRQRAPPGAPPGGALD